MSPTNTFNLIIPPYTVRGHGRDYAYLSTAERITYDDTTKARVSTMIALVRAISPELAELTPSMGAWRQMFSFRFNGGPSFAVRDMLKTSQIEVRVERYSRTYAFRRVKVDPKTGALDPRFVEVVREMVASVVELAASEAAAKVRAASDAEVKAVAFAHAETVLAAAGLSWAYGGAHNHEGTVSLNRNHSHSVRVVGRTMKVELSGVDVDHLPALVAFLKGLTP